MPDFNDLMNSRVGEPSAIYPLGDRLLYWDGAATTSDGEPVLAEGTINGSPLVNDEGEILFVPAWSQRDNGREPNTIMVSVENVVRVEKRTPASERKRGPND